MYDLIVLGAGPGGYVAAIRAAQLGMKVAIVEDKHLGGVCLNWGCIPTKALLKSSEIKEKYLDHSSEFGWRIAKPELELETMVARSRKVAQNLSNGIKHLLKKNNITTFMAYGQFENSNSIKLSTGETLAGKNIIIATGAKARILPDLDPQKSELVLTAKEAMVIKELPKSLLVVGSGAIGIEFASWYNTLGVDVTVIEMQSRILPQEDTEISSLMQKSLEAKGIKFILNNKAEIKITEGKVLLQDKKFDKVLLAIGIVANTADLKLDKTKVKLEKSHIVVNEFCQTAEKNIYAIGDVTGAPWLAHKASHEGIMVAEYIAKGSTHPIKKTNIPGCTYSNPQIASIGETEDQLKQKNIPYKVGKFPYLANGKAMAIGKTEGMVKMLFHKETGEFLGAHMMGVDVTELIHSMALAKAAEATEETIMQTIFPHPTLSEMLHEAALAAEGRAIHI